MEWRFGDVKVSYFVPKFHIYTESAADCRLGGPCAEEE